MKKLLLFVAAIALLAWVVSWFRTPGAVATSGAKPWPGGLGPLGSAAARFPPLPANAASVKLTLLAKALPKGEAVDGFVQREISRGEIVIGEPPALPDVAAVRELLLHEQVMWQRDAQMGGGADSTAQRTAQMTAARALVASALARARARDARAWDDLRAVWNLARTLDGHPQMMAQTAALSMLRMINAVAWKMPLPAPPWLADLQQRDAVQPLVEAFQVQTSSYWNDGSRIFPTKMLADSVDHDRRIAEGLLGMRQCDVSVPMNDLGTDLSSVWRRAFRYRAEREAAANALRVREGKPIEAHSRCSDGGWTFDGTTLRFSRPIATAPPDRPMPLMLRITAAAD
jgi:hypothetical protein